MGLTIDNCAHCGAVTHTTYETVAELLDDYSIGGRIGCWNCIDDGHNHLEFDIFDGDKKVWCGHKKRC